MMHKARLLCLIMIAVLLSGCGSALKRPTMVESPHATTESPKSRPILSHWIPEKHPVLSTGDTTLVIRVNSLTRTDTMLIYTLSGAPAGFNLTEAGVRILDDKGHAYRLLSNQSLAEHGPLLFGVMRFGPRMWDLQELRLQVDRLTGGTGPQEVTLARMSGPPEKYWEIPRGFLWGMWESEAIDQAGYRIFLENYHKPPLAYFEGQTPSFEGIFPLDLSELSESPYPGAPPEPEGQEPAYPGSEYTLSTPTPGVRPALVEGLPEGLVVADEVTLVVENTQDGQVLYLYIQFLNNGSALAAWY